MTEKQAGRELGKAIEILFRLLGEYETRILERSDFRSLSETQLQYLGEIHRNANLTITSLARKVSVSKPSVSIIIEKLISKGLVERARSEEDRRSFHLRLTKSGRKCALLYDGIYGRFAAKAKKILDEKETDALVLLLDKIIAKYSTHD
jgi:DNA-binding MarR family transcriptional regulator